MKELEVQLGAAKTPKYAVSESGDTLEIIERPHGGISAVLVDGQRSGRAAKIVSNIVARKAISLLGEGVRDGAVARAAHDYLRTHRGGQVSAEMQILSVDLVTHTLVISRNTHCPTLIVRGGALERLEGGSGPIGIHVYTKPTIVELPLEANLYVVLVTDGLLEAGTRSGAPLDFYAIVLSSALAGRSAQGLADDILSAALVADQGRPVDDCSVLALAVLPRSEAAEIRRYSVSFAV